MVPLNTEQKSRESYRFLQTDILFITATNGKQTNPSLKNVLESDKSSIRRAIKNLLAKEYISFLHKKRTAGSRGDLTNFYDITDKGLETLSKDSAITQEQFWNIVFHVYEVKTIKTKIPFERFISNYEKHVLGFDLENTPIDLEIILRDLSLIHSVERIEDSGVPMLTILAINKPMSEKNVIKYLKKENPLKTKIDKSNLELSFNRLLQDKLVAKLSDDKNPQYRITVLGFLTIIIKFLNLFKETLYNNYNTKIPFIVKKIIENSKVNLLLISEPWDTLRDIIDEFNIINLFNEIINENMTVSKSIQTGGVKELLTIERNMTQAYTKKIGKEAIIGLEVLSELFNSGIIQEGSSSHVKNKLLFLLIISGATFQGKEKIIESVKGKDFSLEADSERIIYDTIAFEFFIYFIDRMIDSKDRGDEISLTKVKKWNEFQKSNKGFRKWFDNWVKQLLEFEERNVKVLKERPFLNV